MIFLHCLKPHVFDLVGSELSDTFAFQIFAATSTLLLESKYSILLYVLF